MQILLYEHLCASGVEAGQESLLVEGKAMLDAVAEDLRRAGVTVTVPASGQFANLAESNELLRYLSEQAGKVDGIILIAPETHGVLYQLASCVEGAGGNLLGPSAAAIQLTSDKLRLAEYLLRHGVPTPPTCEVEQCGFTYPLVLKPRDGAGSQATFLVETPSELAHSLAQGAAEGFSGKWIAQPFFPGVPASIAFLLGPRQCVPLLPGRQLLSPRRFHYLGSEWSLPPHLASRAVDLGQRALTAVRRELPPSAWIGYIGIDLVLGDRDDGSGDVVIEINPRFTTSYLGLRTMAENNLMTAYLNIAAGLECRPPRWRASSSGE